MRAVQACKAFRSVSHLCHEISGPLAGTAVALGGTTISVGDASDSHTAAATRWAEVPLWPQLITEADADGQGSGCSFRLARCWDSATQKALIFTVSGRGTHIKSCKLDLGTHACVVFDRSCADVHVSDVVFRGAPKHLCKLAVAASACPGFACARSHSCNVQPPHYLTITASANWLP
jgi:hypothetical protein